MRQPLTTLILAAAAGIFCVGTIGFAGYAWHCRNRATDAEKSLEILRARHPTTVVTRPAAATAPVIVDAAGDDARLLARIRELEAQLDRKSVV